MSPVPSDGARPYRLSRATMLHLTTIHLAIQAIDRAAAYAVSLADLFPKFAFGFISTNVKATIEAACLLEHIPKPLPTSILGLIGLNCSFVPI